jgi:hypothetical protein
MLDHHVLTFDVAQVAQPLPERLVEERRHVTQQADPGDLPGRSLGRGGGGRGEEAESESGRERRPNNHHPPSTDGRLSTAAIFRHPSILRNFLRNVI